MRLNVLRLLCLDIVGASLEGQSKFAERCITAFFPPVTLEKNVL